MDYFYFTFGKNTNFVKIQIKNRNVDQKTKFWPKIEISINNRIFFAKNELKISKKRPNFPLRTVNCLKTLCLVTYLPLNADFKSVGKKNRFIYGVSDLHLLMALVQVNEASRDVS